MKKAMVIVVLSFSSFLAISQELEPRVYANLPTKLNVVAFAYGLSKGNVVTDPSLPIEGFKITGHNLGLGYVRTFGLANKLARVQLTIPYVGLAGRLQLNGRDTSASRSGFGDLRIRFGINLLGSPAMSAREFNKYEQRTILGVSFVTTVPTGIYYDDKRINIGSNRWSFKPEIGISHRFKHFYVEGYTGVWFYTENEKFLESKILKQEPVFSIQAHVNYFLSKKMWFGANVNWFNGGQTTVDGVSSGDLKDNWRVGGTWSYGLTPKHAVKLQFHVGAINNAGYDYNILIVGYQFVFF